jgi:hypothetical protein
MCGREAHQWAWNHKMKGTKWRLSGSPHLAELPLLQWVWSTRLNFSLLWLFLASVASYKSQSSFSCPYFLLHRRFPNLQVFAARLGPEIKQNVYVVQYAFNWCTRFFPPYVLSSVLFSWGATAKVARSPWISGGETPCVQCSTRPHPTWGEDPGIQ